MVLEADQIGRRGWRQGSALKSDLVLKLLSDCQIPEFTTPRQAVPNGLFASLRHFWKWMCHFNKHRNEFAPDSEAWIVVSQDCDLVNACFEKEPYVEIIHKRLQATPQKLLYFGNNSRTLQIEIAEKVWEFSISQRCRIDRRYLCDSDPDPNRSLSVSNARSLRRWLSRRYVRAVFPDEFNHRVKRAVDKLSRKPQFSSKTGFITGVYFLCDDDEKPKGEDYLLSIRATVGTEDFFIGERNAAAAAALSTLEAAIGGLEGIEIENAEVIPENQMTLDDLNIWKRWDFDTLSLSNPDQAEPPLE